MDIEANQLTVGGLSVEIVHKQIKNLHLGVYPPDGRVRVAAPTAMSSDAVRLAVVSRLGWIKRQRAKFQSQPRQSERAYISGESHYFLGQRYRLNLVEGARSGSVRVKNRRTLELCVRSISDREARERVFLAWYRVELKSRLGPLVEKWAATLGIPVPHWGVKRMKTNWGTCSIDAKRVWINLELAKKPPHCLEYIVVHELVHFLERNHTDRFVAHMDHYLPPWQAIRSELGAQPLGHEIWPL